MVAVRRHFRHGTAEVDPRPDPQEEMVCGKIATINQRAADLVAVQESVAGERPDTRLENAQRLVLDVEAIHPLARGCLGDPLSLAATASVMVVGPFRPLARESTRLALALPASCQSTLPLGRRSGLRQ